MEHWDAFEVLKVTDSSVITGLRLGSSKWLRNRAIPPLSSGTFLSCNKKVQHAATAATMR